MALPGNLLLYAINHNIDSAKGNLSKTCVYLDSETAIRGSDTIEHCCVMFDQPTHSFITDNFHAVLIIIFREDSISLLTS